MDDVGLSAEQARARLEAEGPNALPEPDRRGGLRIIVEVLREPMLVLLILSGLIYLVLGELSDALILVVFALFSVGVTVIQEFRTERVLQSLRDLTNPKALVIRDGVRQHILGSDVVRGDLIVLREGDRIPADAFVRTGADLQVDESLLTGESVPVRKRPGIASDSTNGRPGGDDLPYVFSGTLVVRGTGLAEVVATGSRSEIGHIGQSLNALRSDTPRLQKETRRLTVVFGVLGAAVTGLAILLYGLVRGNWLNAALAGIALGMSMLPEEFPVVLTVFMAMGAWRISRIGVLTRRASAIESLGSATVLCTDKTGTLTENRMVIAELRLPSGDRCDAADPVNVTSPWNELLRAGVLASAREPFDPMEKAFHVLAASCDAGVGADWQIARSYGLRPDLLAVVQAWVVPGAPGATVAAKGAPEAIAALCRLEADDLARLHAAIDDMAGRGLRVLGLATAQHDDADWPDTPRGYAFRFLGLVGLADPLRQSVPDAVAQCRTAGIRIVMITGDHPQTARAIAQAAGLAGSTIYSGADLQRMDDAELRKAVATCDIFARILPEQKLRIVQALKLNGEVVAMTGDGVNDAPSLKAADIGIAMGGRGTDVAREASAIVLLDDDFGSIVAAIRLGRRIYDNLRKAMGFILAVHIPIAGLALLPLIMGLPVLFWPVHIAFIEMTIDPVCSLVFEAEAEEAMIMRRPPRRHDERLFPLRLIVQSTSQGLIVLALCAGAFLVAGSTGLGGEATRTVVFASLVGGIVSLALANRSFGTSIAASLAFSNRAFGVVLGLVGLVLAGALSIPVVIELFGFSSLGMAQLFAIAGVWTAIFVMLHGLKYLGQERPDSRRPPSLREA